MSVEVIPPTAIVIVNYRTAPLVVDCLQALHAETTSLHIPIYVVEGGSADDSAAILKQAISEYGWSHVTLLELKENRGFSAGNNAAIRLLLQQYPTIPSILLLNPDTVPRPNSVSPLIDFLRANPHVGIVGSRLEDPDGTPQRSSFRFPSIASEWEAGVRLGVISRLLQHALVAPPVQDIAHPCDWVAGASMLTRRDVLDRIGLMDEAYFLYFEETDFCYRAKQAGFDCWYEPKSRVVHLVGQSTGVTNAEAKKKRVPRYWFESRSRYFRQHHGRIRKFIADTCWAVGFASWRIRRVLQRKPDPDPPALLWDFVRFNFFPI